MLYLYSIDFWLQILIRIAMDKSTIKDSTDKDRRNRTDALTRLKGYPHLLDEIFTNLNEATLLEAEKVSPSWKEMIRQYNIYTSETKRTEWKRNMAEPPAWKILAASMEQNQPDLFNRMARGDTSTYHRAYSYVEASLKRECHMKTIHCQELPPGNFIAFRVNESRVFVCYRLKVTVINRWTRRIVQELYPSNRYLYNIQLSDRHITVGSFRSNIFIYDIETYELLQVLNDQTVWTL